MPMRVKFLVLISMGLLAACANSSDLDRYREAGEQIHEYSGSGSQLRHAMQTASELGQSSPTAGYSEALQAEATSLWKVDQDGSPPEAVRQAIGLADAAIKLNPHLVLPHIAKARTLIRTSRYKEAGDELATARKLDSNNDSAVFLDADMMRRTGDFPKAESGYREFIRLTKRPARKSNGYYWLAKTYAAAAQGQPGNRELDIVNAKNAYEEMVRLDPGAAWKINNYAVFLNAEGQDYVAAELYAQKALDIMEFQTARDQLAIARYQQLFLRMGAMGDKELLNSAAEIARSTGVTLGDAINCACRMTPTVERLQALEDRRIRAANR